MKKIFMLGLLVLLLVTTGCRRENEFDFEKGTLVVGLECAYAPFNWLENEPSETNVPIEDLNAYAEGYDIQMAQLLADDLGLELKVKMIEWDGLIIALNSGVIDVIIAGMSPTDERKQEINFTNAYYESEHVVIVKSDGAFAEATDIDDFTDAKIMGQKNTVYDKLAEQLANANQNAEHQTPLSSVPEIINAMNNGITDVTIVERPVALGIINGNSSFKYIELETPFVVDDVDKIVSIGVRKQDNNLLDALNASLAKITNENREQLMLNACNTTPEE